LSRLERATREDLPAILELQRLAFQSEAALVGDSAIPPLTQTLEQLEREFKQRTFLKLEQSGNVVASVRGHRDEAGWAHIGRLMVHPSFRGEGLGSSLMREMEREFSACVGYRIFTSALSTSNLRLYQHLGYRISARERVGALEMVFLTKEGSRHESVDD